MPQNAKLPLLQLEAKIPLGEVSGRIDHLAVDLRRQRLFVAELGNNSVGVVDLKERKLLRTILGLAEPQGVGYVPSSDVLYVASAADGSVRMFEGADYTTAGHIDLGDDADNIRIDSADNRAYVGYGCGAIAVLDLTTHGKIADIPLKAHPESFQLDTSTKQIFVNLPQAQSIAVIDVVAGQQRATWPLRQAGGNFAMALDAKRQQLFAMFRKPAQLGVFSMTDGRLLQSLPACKDADDVFLDARRERLYISCGEGVIDTFERQESRFKHSSRIPTEPGARTSLFVPELELYLLAVRATSREPAAIWVFRPTPQS